MDQKRAADGSPGAFIAAALAALGFALALLGAQTTGSTELISIGLGTIVGGGVVAALAALGR